MRDLLKRGIKRRIVSAMLLVGILPGIAGVFLTYIYATDLIKKAIGNDFQELAILTAAKIDMIIAKEVYELKNLSISPSIVSSVQKANKKARDNKAEDNQFIELLKEFAGLSPDEYLNIIITDEKGGLVSAIKRPQNYFQSKEGWWTSAYNNGKGDVYISDIHFEPELSAYYIKISVPIMDRIRKTAIGVVAVDIRIEQVFFTIIDIKIGKTGHANLVDSDGILIIDPILPIMGTRIDKGLLAHIVTNKSGWTITDDEHGGRYAILGFAPVASTFAYGNESFGGKKWYVFTGLDPNETYAPIYTMLWKVSTIGLLFVGLFSIIGFLISKRLIKPIKLLHQGAAIIGKGNLDYRLDIKTNDEIEELAEGFNSMVQGLKDKITEQQRLKQKILEEEKFLAIGHLSTGIAHEIRNPLSSIKMSLDILSKRLNPSGNDKIRFDIAKKEVKRLEMLVQDVLYFAKPRELFLAQWDINYILEGCLIIMEDQFENKNIEVIKDYSIELEPIPIDREKITQVIFNLLLNSLQAMDSIGSGRLLVKTSLCMDRKMAEIMVSDNGCGIKKEDMNKIFNPFFTTKGDGTGLGLTNVKTIIDQHKGMIDIESEEGAGTTVRIFLPAGVTP